MLMRKLIAQKIEQIVERTLQSSLEETFSIDFSEQQKQIALQMDGIQKEMCSEPRENTMLTGRSTIEQALRSHPEAKSVFAAVQLHSCHNCAVRFDETLFEAAEFYEFSLEQVLVALHGLGLQR